MFENLNWWEIGALVVVALLIFGDKLPNVINDGLRMLRNLRNMANNATSDLSRELGTDITLADLHPKAFIRKHVLSEEDEAALRKPLESLRDDIKRDLEGVHGDLKEVASSAESSLRRGGGGSTPATEAPAAPIAPAQPKALTRSYDLEAT